MHSLLYFYVTAVLIISDLAVWQTNSSINFVREADNKNILVMEIKGIPIHGGISQMIYYYVDVLVGDPLNPSKQSLIIDTGSTLTAFPWSNTWTHWGKHINPQFDILQSKSAEIIRWDSKQWACGSQNQCLFKQSYNEGSSYQGFFVKDSFQFDTGEKNNNFIKFTFGWVTHETNLFFNQAANGILGLGRRTHINNAEPVYYELKRQGYIESLVFSLWFSRNGGKLNIGLFPSSELNIVWTSITSKQSYSFQLNEFKIGGRSLPDFASEIQIDSGSTMVYMTK